MPRIVEFGVWKKEKCGGGGGSCSYVTVGGEVMEWEKVRGGTRGMEVQVCKRKEQGRGAGKDLGGVRGREGWKDGRIDEEVGRWRDFED